MLSAKSIYQKKKKKTAYPRKDLKLRRPKVRSDSVILHINNYFLFYFFYLCKSGLRYMHICSLVQKERTFSSTGLILNVLDTESYPLD